MNTSLRKCLTLAAITAASVAIPAAASASAPEGGLKWTHRPAPAYCRVLRGGTVTDLPPYGSCYHNIWIYNCDQTPWYFDAANHICGWG